jgi:hypothetical protein
MAITVVSGPTAVEPTFSIDGDNLTWVLDSSVKQYCSMKYVADFYPVGPTGVTAGPLRMKCSPNLVTGEATVTGARMLEDYLSSDPFAGLQGFTAAYRSGFVYTVQFGEETDGTVGCTGASFQVALGTAGSTGFAFNGTLQYGEDWNAASWVATDAVGATQSTRFLTNGPTSQYVQTLDESYLYYVCRYSAGGTAPGLRIRVTSSSGIVTNFWMYSFVPQTSVHEVQAVGVGPQNLNRAAVAGLVIDNCGTLTAGPIVSCGDTYDVCLAEVPTTFPC